MRTLIHRLIAREERRFGVPLPHLRELADTSLGGFAKLFLLAPLANHRRHLPRDAWHLARIGATLTEDCGACVEIALYLARRDGVSAFVLDAALKGEEEQLPPDLRDALCFATDISSGQDAPALRHRLRERYGAAALVELALAIATARFFPTFKRALGHSQSCRLPEVANKGEPR